MGLGGHLGGRLGGQCKTKCIDWVDIRVDTFNIKLMELAPLTMTENYRLCAFLLFLPPPLFQGYRVYYHFFIRRFFTERCIYRYF